MEIRYKNSKIEEICTVLKVAQRRYGAEMAAQIHHRIKQLASVRSINDLFQPRFGRCHRLVGDRAGQYAMDLEQPYRLIFIQLDGEIQIVEVQEIVDYH